MSKTNLSKAADSEARPWRGHNWGFFGATQTGKTHLCLQMAAARFEQGMSVLIYDHYKNESYNHIKKKVSIADLPRFLKQNSQATFQIKVQDPEQNFDAFLLICMVHFRFGVVILDDCASFFQYITKTQLAFLKTAKNQQYDVYYQLHNFSETPPKLLANLQKIIVKQTIDELPLPTKVPCRNIVGQALQNVKQRNKMALADQRWAYLLVDIEQGQVIDDDRNEVFSFLDL